MFGLLVLLSFLVSASARCPPRCSCTHTAVRCVYLRLHSIPEVPRDTTLLDLRFNKIRDIHPDDFAHLPNLEVLLLNNNHIYRLRDGVFASLLELRHLYLYKNRIKTIESRAFDGLGNLQQLYLHYNRIDSLPLGVFDEMEKIERLFLHNNRLQRITHGIFSKMSHLRKLRLDGNHLICDCKLMWLAHLLQERRLDTQSAAYCAYPSSLRSKSLLTLSDDHFFCKSPRMTRQPNDVELVSGKTAYFACGAEGDPKPSIKWYHNSNEIPIPHPSGRFYLLPDGTLQINDTTINDRGFYECMAVSPSGKVKSRRASMRSKGKPHFTKEPNDVTIQEGDAVILPCKAEGSPFPDVSWTKDELPLLVGTRYEIIDNGSLRIKYIGKKDGGVYRCTASNYLGAVSKSVRVNVEVAARLTVKPTDVTVSQYETAEFHCSAEGFPQPKIAWLKGGTILQPRGNVEVLDEGVTLVIREADIKDEGTYHCFAQNSGGTVTAEAKLDVLVEAPPKFITLPSDLTVTAGGNLEMPCDVRGTPRPRIIWRKDGIAVGEDARLKVMSDGNLKIGNVSQEDSGVYECEARNRFGFISTTARLVVRPATFSKVSNSLVSSSLDEAREKINNAVERTTNQFLEDRGRTPNELLRLFRFPTGVAREIARAREVYEQTLQIIQSHVEAGLQFDLSDFKYEDVLSREQLELLENLSGCLKHRRMISCTDMCYHNKYRTMDGTCNNFQNPLWGASLTAFHRILKPIYENGFNTPVGWSKTKRYYGYTKPSSRRVSAKILSTDEVTPDPVHTHMLMQWGQFLDHDIDHALPAVAAESFSSGIDCSQSCDLSNPCFPIDIPENDARIEGHTCMEFIRSSAICGSGATSVFSQTVLPREQINQLTSFIDASQIYGYNEDESNRLRNITDGDGLLTEGIIIEGGTKPLLPLNSLGVGMDCRGNENPQSCFLAGDVRANEHLGLLSMHTLWMREHNRIARQLRVINPEWNGETLYQEARKIIGAMMQHITYTHWMPKIVGPRGMKMIGAYRGYDPSVNPSITNVFATAAFRFGHSLIFPILHRLNESYQPIPEGNLPLRQAFFAPWRITEEGGIDPLLRGLIATPAKQKTDSQLLNSELTEQLFSRAHSIGLDLAAMNIQRGRDHALPEYNKWREYCGLKIAENFSDLENDMSVSMRDHLQQLYGHPGNVDLWVGGLAELPVLGAKVGPTFLCLLSEQFRNLRNGDRFWYENAGVFKPEQLTELKQATLARVICDSSDFITHVTKDVFTLPRLQKGFISCEKLPYVNLRLWTECDKTPTVSRRSKRQLHFNDTYDAERMSQLAKFTFIDLDVNNERIEGLEEAIELMQNHFTRANEKIVEGVEKALNSFQKHIKHLTRRIRRLQKHVGLKKVCRDHRGKRKRAGDKWQKSECVHCECKNNEVVCHKMECNVPKCPKFEKKDGVCCPVCPT